MQGERCGDNWESGAERFGMTLGDQRLVIEGNLAIMVGWMWEQSRDAVVHPLLQDTWRF